jgi:hypothetical protein
MHKRNKLTRILVNPEKNEFTQGKVLHRSKQCFSNCGPWTTGDLWWFTRWSVVVLEEKAMKELHQTLNK